VNDTEYNHFNFVVFFFCCFFAVFSRSSPTMDIPQHHRVTMADKHFCFAVLFFPFVFKTKKTQKKRKKKKERRYWILFLLIIIIKFLFFFGLVSLSFIFQLA